LEQLKEQHFIVSAMARHGLPPGISCSACIAAVLFGRHIIWPPVVMHTFAAYHAMIIKGVITRAL
jgi:hypothetical protein